MASFRINGYLDLDIQIIGSMLWAMVMESLESVSDVLPEHGFLAELDETARIQLVMIGSRRTVPVGGYVIEQGEYHDALSIILSGTLRVSCHANGSIVQLAVLQAGDVVGEVSVLDSHKASADVIVVDRPARLLTVTGKDLNALASLDPAAGLTIVKALARELCRLLRHNSENMLRREDALRAHMLDADY